jgi:hypothetical protein
MWPVSTGFLPRLKTGQKRGQFLVSCTASCDEAIKNQKLPGEGSKTTDGGGQRTDIKTQTLTC